MPSRFRSYAAGTRLAPAVRVATAFYRMLRPRELSRLDEQALEYDRLTVSVAKRSLSSGGTCVDAGANRGDLLSAFMTGSPHASFVAFEPIPELARVLRRRCPEADVRTIALSDHVGTATFRYLPNRPAVSSLLLRPERERGEKVTELTVTVEPLDLSVAAQRPVRFVKIDVEGAELALLRGARRLLAEDRPVLVVECAPANLKDVAAELSTVGYTLWLMDQWVCDGDPIASIDAVLTENREFQFVAAPAPVE